MKQNEKMRGLFMRSASPTLEPFEEKLSVNDLKERILEDLDDEFEFQPAEEDQYERELVVDLAKAEAKENNADEIKQCRIALYVPLMQKQIREQFNGIQFTPEIEQYIVNYAIAERGKARNKAYKELRCLVWKEHLHQRFVKPFPSAIITGEVKEQMQGLLDASNGDVDDEQIAELAVGFIPTLLVAEIKHVFQGEFKELELDDALTASLEAAVEVANDKVKFEEQRHNLKLRCIERLNFSVFFEAFPGAVLPDELKNKLEMLSPDTSSFDLISTTRTDMAIALLTPEIEKKFPGIELTAAITDQIEIAASNVKDKQNFQRELRELDILCHKQEILQGVIKDAFPEMYLRIPAQIESAIMALAKARAASNGDVALIKSLGDKLLDKLYEEKLKMDFDIRDASSFRVKIYLESCVELMKKINTQAVEVISKQKEVAEFKKPDLRLRLFHRVSCDFIAVKTPERQTKSSNKNPVKIVDLEKSPAPIIDYKKLCITISKESKKSALYEQKAQFIELKKELRRLTEVFQDLLEELKRRRKKLAGIVRQQQTGRESAEEKEGELQEGAELSPRALTG